MYKEALDVLVGEWYRQPSGGEIEGPVFSFKEKRNEYNKILKLMRDLKRLVQDSEDQDSEGQEKFNDLIKTYLKSSKIMASTDMSALFNKEMIKSTIDFYECAKAFDPKMKIEDIGQAMRNVWIINMIQLLEGKPVAMTPSAFGYSMLYPYTDNFIDAAEIASEYKRQVLSKFGLRLSEGTHMVSLSLGDVSSEDGPECHYQKALDHLVGKIESQYCRVSYPQVYKSLMGIHDAQIKSQIQHGDSLPYELPILNFTFEKGGTSVLADAYLVCGTLSNDQILFYMHYGIILQLCDDLQDMVEDQKNNHQTIYSQLMNRFMLDTMISKTLAFNDRMISRMPDSKWHALYTYCILIMISLSSLNYRAYMSKDFFSKLTQFSPFTLGQLKKIKKEALKLQSIFLKPETMVILKSYVTQMSLDI